MEFDDLEFASKEDLEAIKADPRLAKLHQSMTAGVNKKFQGSAEEKRQLLKTIETLKAQNAELDGGLQEWENLYIQNKGAIDNAILKKGSPGGGDDQPPPRRVAGNDEGKVWEKKFNQLITVINQAGGQFERKLAHQGRMLSLSMQLNDLYRKNPNMDGEKVLDMALESRNFDLPDVYDKVYHDDIFNKALEEKLGPRVDEEIAKRKTNVETGSGATPLKFEVTKEIPKSWADAGTEFLAEREKEAAKP